MSEVAWIGLGHMGVPMAAHLVGAGHTVRGVDIDGTARRTAREAGVEPAGSVAEAVRGADVVFTMLQSGPVVEEVLTGPAGAFAHLAPGAVVVDCSTIGIDMARSLYRRAEEHGVGFVDAPVSGGVQGAEQASLTLMLGGDAVDVARVEPLLKSIGSYIVHVGASGDGQAMKVVNNAMMGISMAASCEAAVLAQRLGLDPQVFYDVVLRSSGDSWTFRNWFPLPGVVPTSPSSHGYEPGFMVDLVHKDLRLATETAEEFDVRMDVVRTAMRLFAEASESGAGKRDLTALALELGAVVRTPGERFGPLDRIA
ncbi:3-hydroxyisobutyrate dehydrogenase [Streptomyces sp. NPDC004539]|uniref:3-hydroxyisobutyrate dehydrogenase n=1 Tax=Streptomyces sp. NPDC004539 TaxID=3154280 RepID=UPI00339EE6C5